MDIGMVYYGLGVLLMAALVVWLGRGQRPESMGGAVAQMAQAAARAQELVAAAEQLWATGRLADDERYAWVRAELQRLFPGLDERQLQATIEAAVYFLRMMGPPAAQLAATQEEADEPPDEPAAHFVPPF